MMLGRFELPTFCLEGRYSIQLSYSTQLYRRWDLHPYGFRPRILSPLCPTSFITSACFILANYIIKEKVCQVVGYTHFSLQGLVLMINSTETIKPTSNLFLMISMWGKPLIKRVSYSARRDLNS